MNVWYFLVSLQHKIWDVVKLDLLKCLESVNLDNKRLMIGWLQILCDMFLTRWL
jgi:hypothetical protein